MKQNERKMMYRIFPRPFTHGGGGGASAGGQSINGGLMSGDIDLTLIDYIIN